MKLGIPKRARNSKKEVLWNENESCVIIHGKNLSIKGTGAKFELSEQAHADLEFASTKKQNMICASFENGEMYFVNTTELGSDVAEAKQYKNNRAFNDTALYKYLVSGKNTHSIKEDVMYKVSTTKVDNVTFEGIEGSFPVVKVSLSEAVAIKSNSGEDITANEITDTPTPTTTVENEGTSEEAEEVAQVPGMSDALDQEDNAPLNDDFSQEREEASHNWGE